MVLSISRLRAKTSISSFPLYRRSASFFFFLFASFIPFVQLPCHPITKAGSFREIGTQRKRVLIRTCTYVLHASTICILRPNIFRKKLLTISLFAAGELRGWEGRKELKWWLGRLGLAVENCKGYRGRRNRERWLAEQRGITEGMLGVVFPPPSEFTTATRKPGGVSSLGTLAKYVARQEDIYKFQV